MRNPITFVAATAAAIALAVALSCGGSSNMSPSGMCTPSGSANTLVIMNNAICPQALTVTRGSQLIITNQDARTHDMASDPHPEHTDCTEINQIGTLNTGQTRSSGNLNTARRCGIHDHLNPDNAALKATITIQ
jgi:transcriptional regulator of nitric oxide reductase